MNYRNALLLSLIVTAFIVLSGCGSKKLVDYPESADYLKLTPEQREIIEPKIALISRLVSQYEEEKADLEKEIEDMKQRTRNMRLSMNRGSGERTQERRDNSMSNLRSRIEELNASCEKYQNSIDTAVQEIKEELNAEQLKLFEKIEVPELEKFELPQMERVRNRRQGMKPGGGGGSGMRMPR